MRFSRMLLGCTVVGGLLAACVHQGAQAPTNGGHDLITAQELEGAGANTLYEAVAKLRPHFLKPRTVTAYGRPATSPLMLYVDGEKMESIDDLRHLPLLDVREVRFYEPQLANLKFARYNNAGGAIAVLLKQPTGSNQ
jgi:hypothetical protein